MRKKKKKKVSIEVKIRKPAAVNAKRVKSKERSKFLFLKEGISSL